MAYISSADFCNPDSIKQSEHPTPYFLFDKTNVSKTVDLYKTAFENSELAYAMKSNSESEVLKAVKDNGCSFEVASIYELDMLKQIGVPPDRIICGTSVKPADHIAIFFEYGVQRYAADSEEELDKLAQRAPGAKVYIRVLVDDSSSVFTMSSKFGVDVQSGEELLIKAQQKGLVPYGLSFNVGSQSTDEEAWGNGIKNVVATIENLQRRGIKLEALNLGGGYPWQYANTYSIPSFEKITEHIQASRQLLPYDMKLIVEPGRGLIAPSMALVIGVIAKIRRASGYWLYADAGAYNALLETMAYQGSIKYKIIPVGDFESDDTSSFILTGPTGDSLDVIDKAAILPESIKPGDKLIIHDVGAYSTVLATRFNGFPKPDLYEL